MKSFVKVYFNLENNELLLEKLQASTSFPKLNNKYSLSQFTNTENNKFTLYNSVSAENFNKIKNSSEYEELFNKSFFNPAKLAGKFTLDAVIENLNSIKKGNKHKFYISYKGCDLKLSKEEQSIFFDILDNFNKTTFNYDLRELLERNLSNSLITPVTQLLEGTGIRLSSNLIEK